ncbi:MAG: hypothetical protein JOS17DRAFT_9907, partial [Linnemannia elongata]
ILAIHTVHSRIPFPLLHFLYVHPLLHSSLYHAYDSPLSQMKTFISARPRLVVSLLPCIVLILNVQVAPAASTDIIHPPTPHSLCSSSAIEPGSLLYPTTAAAAVFPVIHKSPYPTDSSLSLFVDRRVKHALERRAPGDNATHPGDNSGTGTGSRTKAEEEEAARKKAEEEAARKKAEEEEAARKAAEAEAAKKAAEEEAKKKAEINEAARKAAEEEARKRAQEDEAARKADEAEAARRAKEEADRKAAVEEAARKAKEEAEKNNDKDEEHNKGTAHDKDNEQELGGDKDNGAPDVFQDGAITKDNSTEGSKKTTMIAAIAGGAALVAIVVAGFIIRHRREVTRRASAMEAYLSKKVELQPIGIDSDDASTSFSRSNSNNGGNNGQAVYSHRNNSRHGRSQQHLAHPSPHHQQVTQHYDNHHYNDDDNDIILPSMPTLMTTAAGVETSGRYYPQYRYEDYHAVSPVLAQSTLAPRDQYGKYCQKQRHGYYSHPQEPYDEYYDQNMYSTSIAMETIIDPIYRPSPTFVDFPPPSAVAPPSAFLAINTPSEKLSSAAAPVSTSFTSLLPRDPHSLIYSEPTASSYVSVSRNSASAAVARMKDAKGSSKRSHVEALIASETGEGANGE